MSDPAVSVVVVNFNAGPMLAACLRASGRGTLPVQRIVVDNASADDSVGAVAAAAELGDVEMVRNDRNLGFARAVNAGVRRARAPLVLVLNPDCIVFPEAIGVLAATMQRRSRAAVVGGLVLNPDGTEQRGCRRRDPTPGRIVRRMAHPLARHFGAVDNGVDPPAPRCPPEPSKSTPCRAPFSWFGATCSRISAVSTKTTSPALRGPGPVPANSPGGARRAVRARRPRRAPQVRLRRGQHPHRRRTQSVTASSGILTSSTVTACRQRPEPRSGRWRVRTAAASPPGRQGQGTMQIPRNPGMIRAGR
ncbi:MAG: glycosyltransferase family 2 protein [Gammaproteobacteria bacterium]|nr:glycosyltransferase family 2 protein [Gammaproteobacteria bacterium]